MRWAALFLITLPELCGAQNSAEPPSTVPNATVDAGLAYDQHPQTVLDVYVPKTPAQGKRPGAVVIHGGGWMGGTKESVVQKYVAPLLEQGFVVANVEYRLGGVAPAPAAVMDVLKAADWFKENGKRWNVDGDRIIALGNSAGGHLALMAGMASKGARLGPGGKVAAVVNFFGITDVEDQLQGSNQREYAVKWLPEQEGRAELAHKVSPVTYVRKDLPPILTLHGTADDIVPYEHGVRLTKALRDVGADAEVISVGGGRHEFTPEEMTKLWPQIFDFLRKRGILKQNT